MKRVLQIVPRLPPSICGVGDYSLVVAEALERDHRIQSEFLVCDREWAGDKMIGTRAVHQLADRTAKHLHAFLHSNSSTLEGIIVQYSGYGFATRGAPVWLVNGLSAWRKRHSSIPLICMYHELYSSGPFTTSSFWLQPLQKWAIRKLAKVSTTVRTNRAAYQQWLAKSLQVDVEKISSMPVFSNFGETSNLGGLGLKKNQLIAQGLGRTGNFSRSLTILEWLAAACGVDRIKVMGPAPRNLNLHNLKLEYTGYLPAEDISQLLKESRCGYLDYYSGYLAKSGIYAAYCAHGLPAYTFGQPDSSGDGIRHGEQFFDLARDTNFIGRAGEIRLGESAHLWYQNHNVRATAESYAEQLQTPC